MHLLLGDSDSDLFYFIAAWKLKSRCLTTTSWSPVRKKRKVPTSSFQSELIRWCLTTHPDHSGHSRTRRQVVSIFPFCFCSWSLKISNYFTFRTFRVLNTWLWLSPLSKTHHDRRSFFFLNRFPGFLENED